MLNLADFDTVKKYIKKATVTSDLESQVESQSEQADDTKRRKRKTVKTMFTRFASFEVSDDESNETRMNLPEPPKFDGKL